MVNLFGEEDKPEKAAPKKKPLPPPKLAPKRAPVTGYDYGSEPRPMRGVKEGDTFTCWHCCASKPS
jgi:hypothetical protein